MKAREYFLHRLFLVHSIIAPVIMHHIDPGKIIRTTNQTNFTYCNMTFLLNLPNRNWNYAFGGCMAIISLLATFENTILIITFANFSAIRKPGSNKILLSMVITDLISGVVVGPLYSVQALHDEYDCSAAVPRFIVATVLLGASLTTVGFISIDRAHHLIKQQRYSMKDSTLYIVLGLCWIFPILIPTVGLLHFYVASILSFIGGTVIFFIMIISYIALIVALGKYKNAATSNTLRNSFIKNQIEAGKTCVLILTVHALMVLPIIIERVVDALSRPYREHADRPVVLMFITLLMVGNSAVNPLIYSVRIPTIRKHLNKLLKKWKNTVFACTITKHRQKREDVSTTAIKETQKDKAAFKSQQKSKDTVYAAASKDQQQEEVPASEGTSENQKKDESTASGVATKDEQKGKTTASRVAYEDKQKGETVETGVASKDQQTDEATASGVASKDQQREEATTSVVASKDQQRGEAVDSGVASKDQQRDNATASVVASKDQQRVETVDSGALPKNHQKQKDFVAAPKCRKKGFSSKENKMVLHIAP